MILNDPITTWPKCDVLISFYSQDSETDIAFPLEKVRIWKSRVFVLSGNLVNISGQLNE